MNTKAELKSAIANLETEIEAKQALLYKFRGELSGFESRAFIMANSIRRDEVESQEGDAKPWFGNVWGFAEWLKSTACTKRWAEWNGTIYYASDLMGGRMPDMPGRMKDLKD